MDTRIQFKQELRDWILHNIDRGIPPAPLVRSMLEQGFDAGHAAALVNTFWAARAAGTAMPAGFIDPEQVRAAAYRYETPRLLQGNDIRAGGQRMRVAMTVAQPQAALLDHVLSADECDGLIALARPRLAPSTIVDPFSGKDTTNDARRSEGMFFRLEENQLVARIDRRLAQLMGMPLENGEGLQVLHYEQSEASFVPHFDFLMPINPSNIASVQRSGQRVSTLIVYLNDVEEGGQTLFPESGLAVTPRKGSALYFEYCNSAGQLDPASLHAAAPVQAGEKWIVTKWVRQRRFIPAGTTRA
jgi:prolyl 4-hydroxylase